MRARVSHIADQLLKSFWFIPAVMTLGAVVLCALTLAIDSRVSAQDLKAVPGLHTVVYSGGPAGAREVLATIASSMITVAGVVFSITIVALSLASDQFGPRMLQNFTRDRGNQVTLGTFVSAFLYSLLLLRTIDTEDPGSVPHVSVTVALGLAIAGLSVLVYFIHHISVTIQAPNLVAVIGSDFQRSIDELFPDTDQQDDADDTPATDLPEDGEARRVEAFHSGHVQLIDLERLVEIARDHDLVLRLETRPGRFVVPTSTFALAWPASRLTDEVAVMLAGALVTGSGRTPVQDVEFPIRQLAEVAVRCLSPGKNDPFTASTCVDQMSIGLCQAAGRAFPPRTLVDEDGAVRLVVGDPVTYARLIGVGFDPIRQAAKFHATVYVHILDALARIADCVRTEDRLEALVREGRLVVEDAEASVVNEADQEVIEERYDRLLTAAAERRS